MFNLLENPRCAHRRATDHNAGNFRLSAPARDFVGGKQIAIADYRYRYRFRYLPNDAPVCLPRITLRPGASVDGQSRDATFLQNFRDAHRIDGIGIPANSNFCCHGQWGDRLYYRFGDAGECGAIFQESGAAVFRDHFVNRAAKVQVDEIGGNPIDDLLRSLRHVSRVGAKKLHAERPLAFVEIEIFAGALVAAKDAFSGNEFGDKNICAVALADLTKNFVGHTRHRGEIKGEGVREPREPGVHRRYYLTNCTRAQARRVRNERGTNDEGRREARIFNDESYWRPFFVIRILSFLRASSSVSRHSAAASPRSSAATSSCTRSSSLRRNCGSRTMKTSPFSRCS